METPKLCPLAGHPSFDSHHNGCPHGELYVEKCQEFSKWFWWKVQAGIKDELLEKPNEHIERLLPQETVQNLYGKGRQEGFELSRYALIYTLNKRELSHTLKYDIEIAFSALTKKLIQANAKLEELVEQTF